MFLGKTDTLTLFADVRLNFEMPLSQKLVNETTQPISAEAKCLF